jgi:hypothetical protein
VPVSSSMILLVAMVASVSGFGVSRLA